MILRKQYPEDPINKYIRLRIKQSRTESNETQKDLSKILRKTRVAISDLERGRVAVNASDLTQIAAHYRKPVSFFYPPVVKIEGTLSALEEELLIYFADLPEEQKIIAVGYIKQQAELARKAIYREHADEIAKIRAETRKKKRK